MIEAAIQSISDFIRLEQYEQAEALCLEYLAKEVDAHIFCTLLGEIYLRQGRSIEAQLFFEKAIELKSFYEPAQYGLEQIDLLIGLLKQPTAVLVNKYSEEELSNEQFLTIYRMLRETERRIEIIEFLKSKVPVTEKNWRTMWFFANEAKFYEQLEAVDVICDQIAHLHPEFTYAAELPKHTRGYYAPSELDDFLENYFASNPPKDFLFVDVGSFDGAFHSQVRRLYEASGWRGICIEPDSVSFTQLERIYEDNQVLCLNYEIAESELIMPNFPVPVKTLYSVLEETNTQVVDFLSINTAGKALAVLTGLQMPLYAPRLIAVKIGQNSEAIDRFMAKHSYEIVHTAPNYVYYENSAIELHEPVEEVPQITLHRKTADTKKIIALVPAVCYTPYHETFLRSLSLFVDAIILQKPYASERKQMLSAEMLEECRIEGILHAGAREPLHESLDKMLLLARKKRGTHIVVVYPGEIFTANLQENQLFRNTVFQLEPGDTVTMPVVTLKNGTSRFVSDEEYGGCWQRAIFADDGIACYTEGLDEFNRLPFGLHGYEYRLEGTRFCLMQTGLMNEENVKINRAWERFAIKTGHDVQITKQLSEAQLQTIEQTPAEWFAANPYINEEIFQQPDVVSLRCIYTWFNEYGLDYFKDVDDSELDWRVYAALATSTPEVVQEAELQQEVNSITEMMLLDVESALHQQRYDDAEELLAEIMMDDPMNVEALNSFAVLKLLTNEFKAAEEILTQLLSIEPENEVARENLTYLKKIGKLG